MGEIEWDDSLSVGMDLIDEQHKMLIEKLKDLSDDLRKGHEQDKILKTLGFMIDYTDFHFTAEEKVMAENDYPELEDQQQQHAEWPDGRAGQIHKRLPAQLAHHSHKRHGPETRNVLERKRAVKIRTAPYFKSPHHLRYAFFRCLTVSIQMFFCSSMQ